MLSVVENERLMRVGPGTPMGELMRRYWHPIAATGELDGEPVKAVRLLNEDLVLYKDRSGALGLIQKECPHRRVHMLYGIPEQQGLRCPYHGWLFDEKGRCLEMPAEAPDSTFPQRVTVKAYPVQEFAGLIWAYLGPEPTPHLPNWDVFLKENYFRQIGFCVIPCNWLQCMENSVDPVHLEWLHGYYYEYLLERAGMAAGEARERTRPMLRRHKKIGFDLFEHGIIKRRVWEDTDEQHEDWTVGHPLIFPNILKVGGGGLEDFQIRVPVDDTHTLHYWYSSYNPGPGIRVPKQEKIPFYPVPVYDDQGRFEVLFVNGQDTMAWAAQGELADRSQEKLAESDRGIILYRRLLKQQVVIVADGGDPMNVFRDPVKASYIPLAQEQHPRKDPYRRGSLSFGATGKFSPAIQQIEQLFVQASSARTRGL